MYLCKENYKEKISYNLDVKLIQWLSFISIYTSQMECILNKHIEEKITLKPVLNVILWRSQSTCWTLKVINFQITSKTKSCHQNKIQSEEMKDNENENENEKSLKLKTRKHQLD